MTKNDVIHEKTVPALDSPDHLNCEKWKLNAVRNNKIVKNIISKIESQNFKFHNSCISCEYCPNSGMIWYISLAPFTFYSIKQTSIIY